jgi:indole-3-glycerol phosphate synthase
MKILERIIENKREQIELSRKRLPIPNLTKLKNFDRDCISLSESIKSGNGILAEFKRRSPSHGAFANAKLEESIELYNSESISGISVLTDENYFGGSVLDLAAARELTSLPILRKDFIFDEYQLFEAKAYGADAILLVATILDNYYAEQLSLIAKSIGLEVLMEVHSAGELSKLNENVDIVGVNNRNLDTLQTNVKTSVDLIDKLPFKVTKISESGIRSNREIRKLRELGYDGFLIGESILIKPRLLKSLTKGQPHFLI